MRTRNTQSYMALLSLLVFFAFGGCASSHDIPGGRLPGASAQDIAISSDHTSYSTRTPIGVTLSNTSGATYYGLDGHSDCTLIQLQRYDSNTSKWTSVDGCVPAQTPRVLQIPAGVHEPFSLVPESSSDPNAWQDGLYRVAAAFSPSADGVSGERIAYSAGFRING